MTEQQQAEAVAKEINLLVIGLQEFLAILAPDERLGIWADLQEGYCRDCGQELGLSGVCHCTNEE